MTSPEGKGQGEGSAGANTKIGNFRLLHTLGEGGMGVVYAAEHVTMHRRAAIKVLRPELAKDDHAIRRFFNEARATNEIRHPGIVQIFDCGTREDGSPWLIMELLEGETLSRRIARLGRMTTDDLVRIGAQAASVLQAAHDAGIVHRDLKPDNLFIVNNQETLSGERVKVLDFGIAKLSGALSARSMHTQTGMLMGTPLYMSPEQCRGTTKVDARSDIYSLGLILYQMVAGELPFVSEGMGELFDMQMNRPPPPLSERNAAVEPRVAAAIYRALEKDPAQRFQTMVDLQRALGEAGDAAVAAAVAAPARTPAPAPAPDEAAPAAAVSIGARDPSRDGRRQVTDLPVASTTLSAGALQLDQSRARPARRGLPLAIAAAAIVVVGGGAFLALRSPTRDATVSAPARAAAPAPPAATRPSPAPAPATAGGTAKPSSPAPPARIVDLKTTPPGAQVIDLADGHLIGVTPLRQSIARPGDVQLKIEKEGYLPRTVTVPPRRDFKGSFRLERAGSREPREAPDSEHIIKI